MLHEATKRSTYSVLYFTVLYCIILYNTVLYCAKLRCSTDDKSTAKISQINVITCLKITRKKKHVSSTCNEVLTV